MKFSENASALTHILVVSDVEHSKKFYCDILGAKVYREYGGTSCALSFLDSWLLLVTGGEPTKDKPDVIFKIPENKNCVSHAITIRVKDCNAAYEELKSKGVNFLTPPVDWEMEIRCFFRDPDNHLFEISESVNN